MDDHTEKHENNTTEKGRDISLHEHGAKHGPLVEWRSAYPPDREAPPTIAIAFTETETGKAIRVRMRIEEAAALTHDVQKIYGRYLLTKVHSDKSSGTPSDAPSDSQTESVS